MNAARKSKPVTFSSKGQVVIPRHLRREFAIKKGTRLLSPDSCLPQRSQPRTKNQEPKHCALQRVCLRGSLKGKGVLKAMMDDRKAEQDL